MMQKAFNPDEPATSRDDGQPESLRHEFVYIQAGERHLRLTIRIICGDIPSSSRLLISLIKTPMLSEEPVV